MTVATAEGGINDPKYRKFEITQSEKKIKKSEKSL
jgi:hypothetical protein